MRTVNSCAAMAFGIALVCVVVSACSTEKSATTGPVSSTPAVSTSAAPTTVGILPPEADAQGWRGSFARCGAGERLVLLVGALRGFTERFAVCEQAGGVRVLRAVAPKLRDQPFEARFFTFTNNSQQFVTEDGMKLDLSGQMVTVTDDPQANRGVIQGFTVEQYWSAY